MNKLVCIFACISMFACKATVNVPPATANDQTTTAGEGRPTHKPCDTADGFDTAGQLAADGSRWVWNESKKAYQYMTSEEAKKFYAETWDKTKEVAGKAYDSAMEAYHEHEENSAKEDKKTTAGSEP